MTKLLLKRAIDAGLQAMSDCQRNAHKGKVCFDGDEWHETWALLSEARRLLASQDEPSAPQYRKWPGEPPHCMSCSCGMTEEQKKTVPLEDYLRVHRMFMDLKYPDMPYNQNQCFICGADHGNLPCPKMTVTCG